MLVMLLDPKTHARLSKGNNKRVICKVPGTDPFHAAIQNSREQGPYLIVRSTVGRKLRLREGMEVEASLEIDRTPLQFEMPEEFREVLNSDPEAATLFEKLTDGNKRGLIALACTVKSVQKRIDRALIIMDHLKAGIHSPRKIRF